MSKNGWDFGHGEFKYNLHAFNWHQSLGIQSLVLIHISAKLLNFSINCTWSRHQQFFFTKKSCCFFWNWHQLTEYLDWFLNQWVRWLHQPIKETEKRRPLRWAQHEKNIVTKKCWFYSLIKLRNFPKLHFL